MEPAMDSVNTIDVLCKDTSWMQFFIEIKWFVFWSVVFIYIFAKAHAESKKKDQHLLN